MISKIQKNILSFFAPQTEYVYLTTMFEKPIVKEFNRKKIDYTTEIFEYYSVADDILIENFATIFKVKTDDLKYDEDFYNLVMEYRNRVQLEEGSDWENEYLQYKEFMKEVLNIENYG